jgi:Cu2+-exporting ATPase
MSAMPPHALAAAEQRTVCHHCGQDLADGAIGAGYCCSGCEAAAAMISGLGLARYYGLRRLDPQVRAPRPEPVGLGDFDRFITTDPPGTNRLELIVDGLQCAACVWLIEAVLARRPEVIEARLNMTTRRLRLVWRGSRTSAETLVGDVAALGYRAVPFDARAMDSARARRERHLLRCLAIAGFGAGNVMMISIGIWAGESQGMDAPTRDLLHWVSALIALPVVAYAGRPFFSAALGALRAGRTNMDVPISIGVILATAMSLAQTAQGGEHAYFDSATALLFFLLIGRWLDQRARGRALSNAEHILALRAKAVTIVGSDGSREIRHPDRVLPGELVAVAAGEQVGIDGLVEEGQSAIDASLVTGESLPARVGPGDRLFAGTVNLDSPLLLRAVATGESTLLSEIVRLMEAASAHRGRFVALADRVSRRFAPTVHLFALCTFLGWWLLAGQPWMDAMTIAIAVLIITCPCALALAVPVVQVIASSGLMRRGILMKSATALERLAEVDTVVFDKTGTMTRSDMALLADPARDPADEALAARIATGSTHPLSRALVRAIPAQGSAVGLAEVRGSGMSLQGPDGETRLGSAAFCGVADAEQSVLPEMWLVQPDRPAVRFVFEERVRDDAAQVVAQLRSMGMQALLLSGDGEIPVGRVAQAIGVEEAYWRKGPTEKVALLQRLESEGRKVLMIGDGLNDAPALAAAYVSMSPSSAADASQNSADLVYQGERLSPIVESVQTARRARRLIKQNLALALLYNLLTVPLAVAGLVTPLLAAAAMSSSSLLVIGNSFRLTRSRGRT